MKMRKCTAAPMLVLGLLLFSAVGDATRPNFIFFQPDEMRAESLGCYGHPTAKTPNLDSFAASAVRFDQAHVSYTVCSQSRVSFFTGWPTHVAGHRSLWSLLHHWEPNLLKYFKSNNYTVKWWGKNDMFAEDSFNSSVNSAMNMGGPDAGPNSWNQTDPRYYSFLYDAVTQSVEKTMDYRNVAAAIDFLEGKPPEPFVIFLPLLKPHPPYSVGCSVPEPFYSLHPPSSPLRPPDLPRKPDFHKLIREYRNLTKLDTLQETDIKEHGYDSSTTVAVWADHGDYAGDYGLVEKWPSGLEDVLTRVPLLIRTPTGAKGHVVKEQVQLFDIVPTFLELAKISATHVHFGQSLVPQLNGGNGDPDRMVFAEGGYSTHEPRDFEGDPSQGSIPDVSNIYYPKIMQEQDEPLSVCRAVMARSSKHKLIFRTDPKDADHCSELYDLVRDPLELHNVYNNASYREVQEQLKSQILLWMVQTSDVTPWAVDSRTFEPGDAYYKAPMANHGRRSWLPRDIAQDSTPEYGVHYYKK